MPEHRSARKPFWLSEAAIAVFLMTFITCAAALIVLNSIITSRNGFSLSISSSSYSWTYGPTAILIVILSFWRRIDYYYKLREPWRELLAGPTPSKNSLLLDYITNFQVVSITQAVKRHHFPVVASIGGFFLIKFIILVSTTLFVVMETDLETLLNVTMQNKFNSKVFWIPYDGPGLPRPDGREFTSDESDASIWAYLSRINNVTAETANWKIPDDLVTQRFTFRTEASNVTRLERAVDIFVPQVSCEDAILSTSDSTSQFDGTESRNYTFTSETCAYRGILVNPCLGLRYGDPAISINDSNPCQENPRVYSSFRVNCSGGLEIPQTTREWPNDFEPFDIRYAISVADFKSTVKKSKKSKVTDMQLVKSSALICKIGYGIATANATLDPLTGNVSLPRPALDKNLRPLGNLSNIELAEALWENLHNASGYLLVDEKVPTIKLRSRAESIAPGGADALFQLLYAQLGRPETLDPFYETITLKHATISVLEGLVRELARESLLVSKPVKSSAKGWVTESRLHMRPIALWTMVACFLLLSIMCLSLFFLVPHWFRWTAAMSGSLAGSAAILTKSPDLRDVLSGSSNLTIEELKNKLDGFRFSAIRNPDGNLEVQARSSSESTRQVFPITSKDLGKKHIWTPLSARIAMVIPTFLTPLIAIGILELLYHLIRRESHFVRIDGDSDVLSYIIRISSTLVVFGIATMINNLDSTIVVFAPFSNLRSGNSRPDQGFLFYLLSVNPFLVMFKCLQRRQFGPAASNGAALLAGFLTIIVSGLWLPVNSIVVDHPSTALVDNWDFSWFSNHTTDGGAAVALNQVRFGGAKTPPGIWKAMVIPKVILSGDYNGARNGANYTYNVMALEPALECNVVPQNAISTRQYTYEYHGVITGRPMPRNGTLITVEPPGIDHQCSNTSVNGHANLTFRVELEDVSSIPIGKYLDLPQSTAGQASTNCPSIGMLYGTAYKNLTALICSQTIRQVPVSVTYHGNPRLGEIENVQIQDDYKMVQNDVKANTFGYKLQGFLDETLIPFGHQGWFETEWDSFFDHIVNRPDGYPYNTLEGVKNEWRLVRAVTEDYNEYLRHVIHRNIRAGAQSHTVSLLSATNDSSAESFQSTTIGVYSAEITHLIMDATSKLILQVLLAVMTVLSITGFLLVKIRGTLPRDPCSIGSTMALLADSQLCDPAAGILPEDAQHMSESELLNALDGWVFSGNLVGSTVVEENEK